MAKCGICQETDKEVFTLSICNHVFCHECLCKHIIKQLSCRINCPLCPKKISDKIIRECLSSAQIDNYERLSITASTKLAKRCLTANCPVIMIIENENTIFHCTYCDQPNCVKCKRRHYPNECGRVNTNEDALDILAAETMKIRRRQELESQFKDQNYIPNPESFDCPVCCNFILPRKGVIIRNCFHSFCKNCFEGTMNGVNFFNKFKCQICDMDVNDHDIMASITPEKLLNMNLDKAGPKFFRCKSSDCNGLWDHNQCKGSFRCPSCKKMNCLECEDIHEGMSCEAFRRSPRFIEAQKILQKLRITRSIKCNCGRTLIQNGGCGALNCDNCDRHVCVFTGKEAGNFGPQSCGCISTKPCHADCTYGCYPEDK